MRNSTSLRSTLRKGVYFLANDAILDLAIAFLRSFRKYNPSVSLCLVPFREDMRQLLSLQSEYRFEVWQDESLLRECDKISMAFHRRVRGHYRKLAMWEGPYDEFLYIDADTVVLENIDFVFEFLNHFAFVLLYSSPDNQAQVWFPSISQTEKLAPEQIAFGGSAGFIASRKGSMTMEEVRERLPTALQLRQHMRLACADQPLMNYLIVTSGKEYTSLLEIRSTTGRTDIPVERWAGESIGVVRDGRIVWPDSPRALIVHWAGFGHLANQPSMPHADLWNFYRYLAK